MLCVALLHRKRTIETCRMWGKKRSGAEGARIKARSLHRRCAQKQTGEIQENCLVRAPPDILQFPWISVIFGDDFLCLLVYLVLNSGKQDAGSFAWLLVVCLVPYTLATVPWQPVDVRPGA
jgi:hypothetical protein